MKKGSRNLKKNKLQLCTLVAALIVGNGIYTPASGEIISADEVKSKPQNTTTLNYLKDNTIKFDNGTTVDLSKESRYSLTPTGKAPTEANVITKNLYNESTHELTPVNYEIKQNLPDFGSGNTLSINTNNIVQEINYADDSTGITGLT